MLLSLMHRLELPDRWTLMCARSGSYRPPSRFYSVSLFFFLRRSALHHAPTVQVVHANQQAVPPEIYARQPLRQIDGQD